MRTKLPFDVESIKSSLHNHIKTTETRTRNEALRLVESMGKLSSIYYEKHRPRQVASGYPKSLRELLRKDPFTLMPLDTKHLHYPGDEKKSISDMYIAPFKESKGVFSLCQLVTIPQTEMGGSPLVPDEVPAKYPWWPPGHYVLAQPKLGRLELVCALSGGLPGESSVGGFSYTTTSAHLVAAYPLLGSQSRKVTVKAQPWFSGLVGFGSVDTFHDVSGLAVSLKLSANALSTQTTEDNVIVVKSDIGSVIGLGIAEVIKYWPTLWLELNVVCPDLLIISLTLSATVIQKTDSAGWALVDIDGVTSPPGKSPYLSDGGLTLPFFEISICKT